MDASRKKKSKKLLVLINKIYYFCIMDLEI